ncbi:hypothetical protein [[Clostridium] fimetarium]|uniref:DnaJ domain-containing protein n=1 Tax=[Clostridium] fimetarium TaxID=99656 RepID=A0A1I0M081_9FIRM|nr:hypothetical protein [[Clostridium] fimetarium]SEV81670.1 hypothetical protein SAMN05421659_10132 [[Clostridium] fimetarium]
MYCVIQEIETKKPNKYGYFKELISEIHNSSLNGTDLSYYTHHYGYERFERLIKKAYKISIHRSYREDGKVKKKQYPLGTANYYELADGWFSLYDCCDRKVNIIMKELGVTSDEVYELVDVKLDPLSETVQREFQQTEEYKTHQEYENITTEYAVTKTQFNNKYGFDGVSTEYDKCYDVFGNLMNEAYLDKIKADYVVRQEYEKRSSSYQEEYYSNYSNSYSSGIASKPSSLDKETLKQFYRVLSKKFHPDVNPEVDTSKQMQLLNQLKQEWNI